MKKFNILVGILGLTISFNSFGNDLKKTETTSIPIVVKAEIVEGKSIADNISINNNNIVLKSNNIKSVSINDKKIYKKNEVFSYKLEDNKQKFIKVDIKL